jgi:hypothetical protein
MRKDKTEINQRRMTAAYERVRQKVAQDIRSLMGEHKTSYRELAIRLGWPVTTIRRRVNSDDMLLSEASALMFQFGLEFYPVMRPIRPAPESDKGKKSYDTSDTLRQPIMRKMGRKG